MLKLSHDFTPCLPLYAEFSIKICCITGGMPHVSTAEVAFDLPFHFPLPAPMISTCLKMDLDLDTYRVLSAVNSLSKGALSNLRPLQWPSAYLFSLWWKGMHLRPKLGWWSHTPEPIFRLCHWHLSTVGSYPLQPGIEGIIVCSCSNCLKQRMWMIILEATIIFQTTIGKTRGFLRSDWMWDDVLPLLGSEPFSQENQTTFRS